MASMMMKMMMPSMPSVPKVIILSKIFIAEEIVFTMIFTMLMMMFRWGVMRRHQGCQKRSRRRRRGSGRKTWRGELGGDQDDDAGSKDEVVGGFGKNGGNGDNGNGGNSDGGDGGDGDGEVLDMVGQIRNRR